MQLVRMLDLVLLKLEWLIWLDYYNCIVRDVVMLTVMAKTISADYT
jgi:hypothetical protein